MKKWILFKIIILIIVLSNSTIFAQKPNKNIQPLYYYLQNNADSTIVLTYNKNPITPVIHFIISKKNNLITLYLYNSPYDKRGKEMIPTEIRNFFQKRDIILNQLKADTNAFFNVKYIKPNKAYKLWNKTAKLNPWNLKDDSVEGEGCNELKNNAIYDGGSIRLFLITKENIKQLNYYAPHYYVSMCPNRKDILTIIKIENLFKTYFNLND